MRDGIDKCKRCIVFDGVCINCGWSVRDMKERRKEYFQRRKREARGKGSRNGIQR